MNILESTINQFDRDPLAALPRVAIPGTTYDGREFRSPVFRVRAESPQHLSLHLTGDFTDYDAVRDGRVEAKNTQTLQQVLNDMSSPQGRIVSNVGVSISITVVIDGAQFAVMQYRPRSGIHGLLSGYVAAPSHRDHISGRGLVSNQALEEVRQEMVAAERPGLAISGTVAGDALKKIFSEFVLARGELVQRGDGKVVDLGKPYEELLYAGPTSRWHIEQSALPGYLYNLHGVTTQSIDREAMPNVGFQYARQWNAGQLFFAFELTLPEKREGLFLFHAEDVPRESGAPWELESQLGPDNLILIKLDGVGHLSEETFLYRDGNLIRREAFDRSNIILSEAFMPPCANDWRFAGFIEHSMIPFAEYQRALRERGF